MKSVLSIQGLQKAYGSRKALTGIDLDVRDGEILALLGPTGAGKSSTLMCVAGLTKPDAGRIMLAGEDVTSADPRLRDVSIVFEGFNLLPLLSAYDNIAFPLRSPIYGVAADEVDRRVRKAAADLRIGHLMERRIEQLSGGERQRVAIARALVRNPKLYLLDEPLSALDLKLRESLRLELRELQKQHGATILYATHDYHGAAAIADRIALIDRGNIVQIGTLDELLDDPRNVAAGKLIGSPSMALFSAAIRNGEAVIAGSGRTFALADLGLPPGRQGRVTVGLWPEDIPLQSTAAVGLLKGEVYATDFRGMDRALQIRFGAEVFRKVVPLDVSLAEGNSCWFDLPERLAFVFDRDTGERLNSPQSEKRS
ncbi:hypothetical protein BH10PSE7_BH10PSE7_24820 [soil metagenome]